jgi:hypothetical protein
MDGSLRHQLECLSKSWGAEEEAINEQRAFFYLQKASKLTKVNARITGS